MNFSDEMRQIRAEVEALKAAKLKALAMLPIVDKTITVTLNKTSPHNWFILDIQTLDHKTPLFMVCYKVLSGPQPRVMDSSRRYIGADGKIAIKHIVLFPATSETQIRLQITVRCTNDFSLTARTN